MKIDEEQIRSVISHAIEEISQKGQIQFILSQSAIESLLTVACLSMGNILMPNLDQALGFLDKILIACEPENPSDPIWKEIRKFIEEVD